MVILQIVLMNYPVIYRELCEYLLLPIFTAEKVGSCLVSVKART